MRMFLTSLLGGMLVSTAAAMAEDTFSITASNGIYFDQDTARARVKWAEPESWSFTSGKLTMRVQGFRLGDAPVAETDELISNNTGFSFTAEVDGEPKALSCKLGADEVGTVKRTELTETRVAGSFRVELERCLDAYTAEPIDYPDLPIVVEGVFSVDRKSWP